MPPTITGIKPTGLPHLGNYLGMIRPALDLARTGDALCFIAGYHALTTLPPPDSVRASALDLAATLIADILIHLAGRVPVGSDQRHMQRSPGTWPGASTGCTARCSWCPSRPWTSGS